MPTLCLDGPSHNVNMPGRWRQRRAEDVSAPKGVSPCPERWMQMVSCFFRWSTVPRAARARAPRGARADGVGGSRPLKHGSKIETIT